MAGVGEYTTNLVDDGGAALDGCCGDDSSEVFAPYCTGVSGVPRACCPSDAYCTNAAGLCQYTCQPKGDCFPNTDSIMGAIPY